MFRSPPALRSGVKVKPVLLSTTDNDKFQSASTSAPSTPTDTAMSKKADVIDPSIIENCVSKYLDGHSVIDSLVDRLAEKMKDVVESAVRAAMTAVNKELDRLRGEVARLSSGLQAVETKLAERLDDMEQYQRRNNLRIFGIEEVQGEDTDQLVNTLCKDKLGIVLHEISVCRSHRVGKPPGPAADGRRRHRPIIVRFTSYRDRRRVFNSKKLLKGSGITIKEDLTAHRLEVLKKAASIHGPTNTWTRDGRVLWVDRAGNRGAATRLADLTPTPGGR